MASAAGRTLISGGTIVAATGRSAGDVLLDGEVIAAILAPEQAEANGITADRVIDATGKYVIPGGVDVHVHMQLDMGDVVASDTFEAGTIAAAWCGVTTNGGSDSPGRGTGSVGTNVSCRPCRRPCGSVHTRGATRVG